MTIWCYEYSPVQKCGHVDTLKRVLDANKRTVRKVWNLAMFLLWFSCPMTPRKNTAYGLKGASLMGKASQRKGADGERELAAILRDHGYNIRRGGSLSFGTVPDLCGLPGVHMEVKRCETLRLSDWMQQAEDDAQRFGDGAPVVFYRRSREPWRVVMNLPDWLRLYEQSRRG